MQYLFDDIFACAKCLCVEQDLGLFCVCVCVYLAPEFSVVQKQVSELLDGRILVGHSVQNDLKVCRHTYVHRFSSMESNSIAHLCM